MFRKSLAVMVLGLAAGSVANASDVSKDPDFQNLQKEVKELRTELRELVGVLRSAQSNHATPNMLPASFSGAEGDVIQQVQARNEGPAHPPRGPGHHAGVHPPQGPGPHVGHGPQLGYAPHMPQHYLGAPDVLRILQNKLRERHEQEIKQRQEREIGCVLKDLMSKATHCDDDCKKPQCQTPKQTTSYYVPYAPCDTTPRLGLGCLSW